MTPQLLSLYQQCRQRKPFMLVGHDASCSLRAARTILEFKELEREGLVRLRAEEEQENYFDVFGKPEGYTNAQGHWVTEEQAAKELEELLESRGCWWTVSEWFDGEDWQHADSCGMHTGYRDPLDPFENCYIVDHMRAAIDAVKDHLAELEREKTESLDAACRDIATV